MHFYFARYDYEIAVVAIGLDIKYIQSLAGKTPVYGSFEDVPTNVSSIAVCSIDENRETINLDPLEPLNGVVFCLKMIL